MHFQDSCDMLRLLRFELAAYVTFHLSSSSIIFHLSSFISSDLVTSTTRPISTAPLVSLKKGATRKIGNKRERKDRRKTSAGEDVESGKVRERDTGGEREKGR